MTRIIYDTTGKIFDIRTGNYDIPVGIPCLQVEVPEGKYITGVNVSVTPNVPIYTDYPVSLDKKVGFAEQDIIALYDAINVIMTDVIPSLMV